MNGRPTRSLWCCHQWLTKVRERKEQTGYRQSYLFNDIYVRIYEHLELHVKRGLLLTHTNHNYFLKKCNFKVHIKSKQRWKLFSPSSPFWRLFGLEKKDYNLIIIGMIGQAWSKLMTFWNCTGTLKSIWRY